MFIALRLARLVQNRESPGRMVVVRDRILSAMGSLTPGLLEGMAVALLNCKSMLNRILLLKTSQVPAFEQLEGQLP